MGGGNIKATLLKIKDFLAQVDSGNSTTLAPNLISALHPESLRYPQTIKPETSDCLDLSLQCKPDDRY